MTVATQSHIDKVDFTEEGYIVDPEAWSPEVAEAIAEREGIQLSDRHWIVLNFAREVHAEEGEAPTLRRITLDTEVKTKEMYSLFPGGPGKLASMIAGLNKPTGCI
jgi:tRNA 2-thiouridine synthesizing protein E